VTKRSISKSRGIFGIAFSVAAGHSFADGEGKETYLLTVPDSENHPGKSFSTPTGYTGHAKRCKPTFKGTMLAAVDFAKRFFPVLPEGA